jgi:hypothetical protein
MQIQTIVRLHGLRGELERLHSAATANAAFIYSDEVTV